MAGCIHMKLFGAHLLTGLPLLAVNNLLYGGFIAVLCTWSSHPPDPYWLAVGLVYASFLEYAMHRFLLHAGFERFTKLHCEHHDRFRCAAMRFKTPGDWQFILFSPATTLSILVIGAGHWLLASVLGFAEIGHALALAVAGYFFLYEWLHLAAHAPQRVLRRFPPLRFLRHHHYVHHSYRHPSINFNVALPFADFVLNDLVVAARGRNLR